MVTLSVSGSYKNTRNFLEKIRKMNIENILKKYGEQGVKALASATPKDTGKTAASWSYKIVNTAKGFKLSWINSNVNNGVNIALIIQYGHGTGTGAYVQGRDYINPALKPIFDEIANSVWKEVTMK